MCLDNPNFGRGGLSSHPNAERRARRSRPALVAICFVVFAQLSFAGVYDGPTTDAAFTQLLSDVDAKRVDLVAKMDEAEQAGHTTAYAQVSLATLDEYRNVIAIWDRENNQFIQDMYSARSFLGNRDPVGAEGVPFDELADCIELADAAIAELQRQIDGELILQAPPDFASGNTRVAGGRFERDGKAVIPSKFFWGKFQENLLQAYGRMGEQYMAVSDMESATTIREGRRTLLHSSIEDQVAANRLPLQTFLGHYVQPDSWARIEHPEVFERGGREFTDYDIDNPLVRQWIETLLDEMLGDQSARLGDSERIHMLSNEPNFAIRQGGRDASHGVSDLTMDKYGVWLQNKYTSITELNAVYGTSHADFASVKATYTIPLANSYRGGPVWYDWMRFNMDRVNEWFQFLNDEVKAVDPAGKTHIKLWGEGSIHQDFVDEGIDIEYVVDLVDVPGTDNQMSSSTAHYNTRRNLDWQDRWILEWRTQAIMLDFVKSLAPNKPFFDSEWHGLSGGRWLDFHLPPEFVKAGLWLAGTNGLNAMNAWLWNRRSDGSVRASVYLATSDFQPIQMDAFGRAFKELNAHGNAVDSVVPSERYHIIYYSQDSAIQDGQYPENLIDVYEALKILNVPVGFTTPKRLGSVSIESQTLIVPSTAYVSDADFAGIQAFAQAGGRVVLVDPDNCFARTELGALREGELGFTPFGELELGEVLGMADSFGSLLQSVIPELPVQLTVEDENANPAYGVLLTQDQEASVGRRTFSLINVSQGLRSVEVELSSGDGDEVVLVDLLTGREYGENFTMDPYEVLLLREQGTSAWQALVEQHGLSGDLAADFDADGVVDFEEYAFGGDPVDPLVRGHRPRTQINEDGSITFTFVRPSHNRWDIDYVAQWTEDIEAGVWTSDWEVQSSSPSAYEGLEVSSHKVTDGEIELILFRVKLENVE
ncbi:alpha-amylase family protein [Pelagicoccus mobilis]|uniref:Beta-galactosidase n=1 Tax=Pelagicoccus mobilis TaxID=415221 RepID=A0A934RXR1_9BACT|nr:alpha-amylase family protein [Pelagicoccus mobilis]MBK1879670.1 beta-galactosidase [Pelagicoccus mobilis]